MFSSRTAWNLTTNRFTEAVERKRRAGSELLDLTASNPTTCGFQYDADAILGALNNSKSLTYEPSAAGIAEARAAVAKYYVSRANGSPVISVDDLLLTTSTSEGYSFLFRLLCNAGDEVLIPRPSYPLFDFLANLADVCLVPYSLIYDHGWQVDFHSLESAVTAKTKAVIVVNPNNPTGSYLKPEELAQLNEICARKQLAIIADEVFLDYPLSPSSAAPTMTGNTGALTFVLSGLSKICGLPQMKVAWIATSGPVEPKREALARLEVIADTYLSMNAPVQWALPALLNLRGDFQAQLLQRVRKNLVELDRQLSSSRSQACRRLDVEGGWYANLKVPATQSDEELAIELIEKHSVVAHPGHFFDFESDGYLILSLITPEEQFGEGVKKILASIG
jgi:alanine-synthesizing transaminase